MLVLATLILCASAAALVSVSVPPTGPNTIHNANDFLKLLNSTNGGDDHGPGELYLLETPDHVKMWVLHTWGSNEKMGFTHGMLLAPLLKEFVDVALPAFFKSELAALNSTKLPKWLQKVLQEAENNASPIVEALLAAVYERERSYINNTKSHAAAEMEAMAKGACASGLFANCDVGKLTTAINHMNMIPELVKMTCSMFGAWGKATADGKLIQLRSLDFGDGPFANYTVITARHPSDGGNDFVAVGFPGWSGAVTGFSSKVAISEKVWETYDAVDVQPGHYDGEPVAMVIRDIMQFSNSRADAIAYAQSIRRTWAVFIGVGDTSQQFDALGYREKDLQVFSPSNISKITHMPVYDDVVYIDKHPQPSHDNVTMPALIERYYGQLTADDAVRYIPREMQSGDLHVAVYDFGARMAYVSIGLVTAEGKYGADDISGKACNRPYIKFDMDEILTKAPSLRLSA